MQQSDKQLYGVLASPLFEYKPEPFGKRFDPERYLNESEPAEESEPTKICVICKQRLPLSAFSKNKNGKDGYRTECKSCKLKKEKERKAKGLVRSKILSERINESGEVVLGRVCTGCGIWKDFTQFWRDRNSPSGINSKCIDCSKRINNTEEKRKLRREHFQRNKIIYRLHRTKRRAIKKALPATITPSEENAILNQYHGSCPLTGLSSDLHWDHFICLDTGHGGTTYENMIPLHKDLNISKGSKNPFEWIQSIDDPQIKERFRFVVKDLAARNGLKVSEYRSFVNWCYNNPRMIEQIHADPRPSIELWRESCSKAKSCS